MTATPTAEQFLTLPPDPDEDDTDQQPASATQDDALASIAASLEGLLRVADRYLGQVDAAHVSAEKYDDVVAENQAITELHDAKQAQIDQVLAVCKPSVSKLANQIREVLEPMPAAPTPEQPAEAGDQPSTETPAEAGVPDRDAPLEEWLDFAESRGLDIDRGRTNRSQIRTMLGLAQTEGEATS